MPRTYWSRRWWLSDLRREIVKKTKWSVLAMTRLGRCGQTIVRDARRKILGYCLLRSWASSKGIVQSLPTKRAAIIQKDLKFPCSNTKSPWRNICRSNNHKPPTRWCEWKISSLKGNRQVQIRFLLSCDGEGGVQSARSPFTSHLASATANYNWRRTEPWERWANFYRIHSTSGDSSLVGFQSTLCNLPDIVGEFLFLDDEEMILISLDQA